MEKIAFIVDKLNAPPFSKGYSTMAEFDGESGFDLFNIFCQIVVAIDPEQENIYKEPAEFQVPRITHFLRVMKYDLNENAIDEFQDMLTIGDKSTIHDIMFWTLQKFDTLQKRAYLAKYLLPVDVPPEFMNDDLILELIDTMKNLQSDFKEIHKTADKVQNSGVRISDLKADIVQLEQEKTQLQNKIQKMKKDIQVNDSYFQDMLKATGMLRKEQEEESILYQRLRDNRQNLQETEYKLNEVTRRYGTLRSGGSQNLTPEQLLQKLQKEVKELYDQSEQISQVLGEKEAHLEKLQSWETNDRILTDDDVQIKREQVRGLEEDIETLQHRLDAALEKNPKLTVFRQASVMAQKKLKEKEEEFDKMSEEKKRILKLIQEKEHAYEQKMNQLNKGKMNKNERANFAHALQEKNEQYKKARDFLSKLRAELVILQRTEQIIKNKYLSSPNGDKRKLADICDDVEKKRVANGLSHIIHDISKGVTDDISTDGMSLDQLAQVVDNIVKEFKQRQNSLQSVMNELRVVRQEFTEVEAEYTDRRTQFEKMTVGLEMEKIALEKECDEYQEECLREESRYHYITNLIFINRIKLERVEQEKNWQMNKGRLMRDFQSYKELYTHKLTQQEQLMKQLRASQRDLKESSETKSGQKEAFQNLHKLLTAKLQCEQQGGSNSNINSRTGSVPTTANSAEGKRDPGYYNYH